MRWQGDDTDDEELTGVRKKERKLEHHPHLLKAQQALALQIAKDVGRPSTVSFSAPSLHHTTH